MSNLKLQILNEINNSNNWKFPRGFTLLEMILVFTLIGSLTAAGLGSFLSYSRNQTFQSTVSNISHTLDLLRSHALSYVKPKECVSGSLEGYKFSYVTGGTSYLTQVRCGGTDYLLSTVNLPEKVIFGTGSVVFFHASTGTIDEPVTISLTQSDKTATIQIDSTGVISTK